MNTLDSTESQELSLGIFLQYQALLEGDLEEANIYLANPVDCKLTSSSLGERCNWIAQFDDRHSDSGLSENNRVFIKEVLRSTKELAEVIRKRDEGIRWFWNVAWQYWLGIENDIGFDDLHRQAVMNEAARIASMSRSDEQDNEDMSYPPDSDGEMRPTSRPWSEMDDIKVIIQYRPGSKGFAPQMDGQPYRIRKRTKTKLSKSISAEY